MTRGLDVLEIGRKKTRKSLPTIAKELGLTYIPPEDEECTGGMEGKYQGFLVDIPIDDKSTLNIEFKTESKIHLSNGKPSRSHMNKGMDPFDFQDKLVNKLFTTRFASKKLIPSLISSQEVVMFVNPHYSWFSL